METEDAIERMAEYRAASKDKQISSNEIKDTSPIVKQLRGYAIKFYWVNAVFYSTISFAILFAGSQAVNFGLYVFLPLTVLMIRQSFRTIERLDSTDGRGTIFDDAFISALSIITFFFLYPFNPFPQEVFTTIHVLFSIIWVAQLYLVFYKKPPIQYSSDIMIDNIDEVFFSRSRIIALSVGLVLGIALALPFYI